jgi:hypothetical protein
MGARTRTISGERGQSSVQGGSGSGGGGGEGIAVGWGWLVPERELGLHLVPK